MTSKLALEGGPKAVGMLGPFPTKIGKEEDSIDELIC
jgi:hypothetical protein